MWWIQYRWIDFRYFRRLDRETTAEIKPATKITSEAGAASAAAAVKSIYHAVCQLDALALSPGASRSMATVFPPKPLAAADTRIVQLATAPMWWSVRRSEVDTWTVVESAPASFRWYPVRRTSSTTGHRIQRHTRQRQRSGGFTRVQHVRPNRDLLGPHKKGPHKRSGKFFACRK